MHLRLPAAAPPRRVPAPRPETTGPAESTAVALLMAGTFVLPIVSPLAAMVIVSASRRWSGAQKAAAWLLTGGATLCGFLLMLVAAAFTNGSGLAIVLGYLTMVAGAFIAGVTLLPGLIAAGLGDQHIGSRPDCAARAGATSGLALRATDTAWQHGSGPEVSGPMVAW